MRMIGIDTCHANLIKARVLPATLTPAGGKARRLCVQTNFFAFRNIGRLSHLSNFGDL